MDLSQERFAQIAGNILETVYDMGNGIYNTIELVLIKTAHSWGYAEACETNDKEQEFRDRVDKIVEAIKLNIINDTMTTEAIIAEIKKISEAYKEGE